MLNVLLISIAAAGIGASEPVIFVDDRATLRVNVAGYDLAKAAEKQRLDRRIVWAAARVCKANIPGADQRELVACTRAALDNARRQLDVAVAQHQSDAPAIAGIVATTAVK